MIRPVLALDLATRTGWALVGAEGRLVHGANTLPHKIGDKADAATRLRSAEDFLQDHLRHVAGGRGDLVYETPVLGGTYGNSVRVACHLEATLLAMARAFCVPDSCLYGYAPKEVKKWLTGNGNANKADMVAAVEERWGLGITDDNEADSVALLQLHLERVAAPGGES